VVTYREVEDSLSWKICGLKLEGFVVWVK